MVYKVMFDPGHGGTDPGAVDNGIAEKDIVLTLALKAKAHIEKYYPNIKVMMTRSTNVFWALGKRTNYANQQKVDAFVSFHVNSASNKNANGFETFRYPGTKGDTLRLQSYLHDAIMAVNKQFGVTMDRGKKTGNLHVLRESHMSAILTENLFISNTNDNQTLKNSAYLDAVAVAHAEGVAAYFGQDIIKVGTSEPKKEVTNPAAPVTPPKKEEPKVDTSKLPVSEQFKEEVKEAVKRGITNGARPQDLTKREEVMVMVKRVGEFQSYQTNELAKTFAEVKDKLPLQKPEQWEEKLKSGDITQQEVIYLMAQLTLRSFK
ncbi:N-acetylmuramoyl-L-alanine amidase family protein [Priestia filamentosa]|uniref:N-acetylmuramoyl-L-alanine amidase family protein n=1 Tax=Priestia filamentosa TaxID=1402861 RepID=UPI003982A7DA